MSGSSAAIVLGKVAPGRRCFLNGVSNIYGANNFAKPSDLLEVYAWAGKWWLGGNGNVAGSARCIDIATEEGDWAIGSTAAPLREVLKFDEAGMQCFLTSIGGTLRSQSFTAGGSVSVNPGTHKWELKTATGVFAGTSCVKVGRSPPWSRQRASSSPRWRVTGGDRATGLR